MPKRESEQATEVLRLISPVLDALNSAPCMGDGCEYRSKGQGKADPSRCCDACAALYYAYHVSSSVKSWRRGALLVEAGT